MPVLVNVVMELLFSIPAAPPVTLIVPLLIRDVRPILLLKAALPRIAVMVPLLVTEVDGLTSVVTAEVPLESDTVAPLEITIFPAPTKYKFSQEIVTLEFWAHVAAEALTLKSVLKKIPNRGWREYLEKSLNNAIIMPPLK